MRQTPPVPYPLRDHVAFTDPLASLSLPFPPLAHLPPHPPPSLLSRAFFPLPLPPLLSSIFRPSLPPLPLLSRNFLPPPPPPLPLLSPTLTSCSASVSPTPRRRTRETTAPGSPTYDGSVVVGREGSMKGQGAVVTTTRPPSGGSATWRERR